MAIFKAFDPAAMLSPSPSEAVSQFNRTVIPGEQNDLGRDPWFDRLTTLSEVEGECRKLAENQIILDPGSHPAPRDLAGMTNWETDSQRGGDRFQVE